MVLMPGEVRLRHVSTPADILGILKSLNIDIEPAMLQATELRLAGNALAGGGDLEGAISKYQEALDLQPSKGQHMLYSNLSAAYLQLGKHEAALQAAKASVDLAPKGFHMAHVRYVDALYACARFDEAATALHHAVAADHSFKSIPEYKVMEQALKKYMPRVNA
jgi:tetratricopeptide (TPR) repeat protein